MIIKIDGIYYNWFSFSCLRYRLAVLECVGGYLADRSVISKTGVAEALSKAIMSAFFVISLKLPIRSQGYATFYGSKDFIIMGQANYCDYYVFH